ncbi:hypothetical protein OH784_23900 [Ectobacillus funiculus]
MGEVIGAGLFGGSGTVIYNVGSGAILAHLISEIIMVMVTKVLGELAILNLLSGSSSEYVRGAISPWAGLMLGAYQFYWIIAIAIEVIAGGSLLNDSTSILVNSHLLS